MTFLIPSTTLLQFIAPFPTRPALYFLFCFKSFKTNLGCQNTLWCVVFCRRVVGLPGARLRDCFSFSQQLTIASSSLAWGGSVCPVPLFLLGFGLIWSCTGFVHAVTTAVSSLCSCPDVSWRQYFYGHSPSLSLTFIPPRLQGWEAGYGMYVPQRSEHSAVS